MIRSIKRSRRNAKAQTKRRKKVDPNDIPEKSFDYRMKVLLVGVTIFVIGLWGVLGVHWNVFGPRDVNAIHNTN